MAQAMLDKDLKINKMEWTDPESGSDEMEKKHDDLGTKGDQSPEVEIIIKKGDTYTENTGTSIDSDSIDFIQILRIVNSKEYEVLFQYKENYIDIQFYIEFNDANGEDVLAFFSKTCNYKCYNILPYAKFSKAKQFFSIKTPQTLLKIESKICNKIKSRTQYVIDFGSDNSYIFTLEFNTIDTKYIYIQHEYKFTDNLDFRKSIHLLYDNFKQITNAKSIILPTKPEKNKKKNSLLNSSTVQDFENEQLKELSVNNKNCTYDKKLTPDINILPINKNILETCMFDLYDNCSHSNTTIEHVQTRSADEQATAIVRCMDCGVRI